MTEVKSRILKTENVKWKNLKVIQPSGFKDLSKDAYAKLRQSIITNNFIDPFKVWENCENLYVVDGVHRIKVLNELEKEGHVIPQEFPANFIECENRKKAAKLVLIYSSIYARIQEESLYEFLHTEELNFDELKLEIDLPSIDLDRFEDGWMRDTKEDDFDVEQAVRKPKYDVKMGDVFQLKNHRLMCGDSTKREDVEKLINKNQIDMLFTDPPYGINIVQIKEPATKSDASDFGGRLGFIGADGIVPVNAYPEIIGDNTTQTIKTCFELCKELGIKNMIIWGGNYFTDFLPPSPCWIIWDKREGIPSNNFADCEIAWTSFDKPARIYRQLWSGLLRKGNRKEELSNRIHPTQKPVRLHVDILKDFSKDGEIIIDFFGGSGSTLIAAEQTNRICYMMEISLLYISVILERYIKYIGTDEQVFRLNEDGSKTPISELEVTTPHD